jgi:hypothetical protein
MKHKLIAASVVGVLALGGGGAALAVSGDDGETPATGPAASRAAAAALRYTGGGTVGAVELDTEKGATWEVEVTRLDGSTVDVRLDAGLGLVVVDGDAETEAEA